VTLNNFVFEYVNLKLFRKCPIQSYLQ